MPRDPSVDRQYTEKEIRAILQRAGKIQDAITSGENGFEGTTLAQLQQAASELALDPEVIAQAAREVEIEATVAKSTGLKGRPWKVDFDQIVPGAVTEDTWPYIVDEIRAVTGRVSPHMGKTRAFGLPLVLVIGGFYSMSCPPSSPYWWISSPARSPPKADSCLPTC
jgi:hypothetical protein